MMFKYELAYLNKIVLKKKNGVEGRGRKIIIFVSQTCIFLSSWYAGKLQE